MKGRVKTVFLVLGTACFVAMASGWVLYLHLAHDEDPAEHDTTHCSLCQQLLVSKKSFTVDSEPTCVELDPAGHIAAVSSTTPIYHAYPNLCNPRAPPA